MIANEHRYVDRFRRLPALRALIGFCLVVCGSGPLRAEGPPVKPVQRAEIRVGINGANLQGNDHRALQAAVDYVAQLGGGTVRIGPGRYSMRNALRLRDNVNIIGVPGETILVA